MVEASAHKKRLVITIDGPAGAGKSTAARLLAKRLGYTYLDTGALYRAVAWKIKVTGINHSNGELLRQFLSAIDFRISLKGGETTIIIDSQDVTPFLRTSDVTNLASSLAAISQIRDWLLPIQQKLGESGGIVAEGRDLGTRVFPKATAKFYLEADLETRTKRRFQENLKAGQHRPQQEIQHEIKERDSRDRMREIGPLVSAHDAAIIDSSLLSVDEVVDKMQELIPTQP